MNDYRFNSSDVEYLNKIIETAILYGGDTGGPYCMDVTDLANLIKAFMHHMGLDKEYVLVLDKDYYPIIAKKINVE